MKELINLLENNRYSIAFVVGNGIHRYYETALSWDKLLDELWEKYADNPSANRPTGISNTELYDIIEMQYCKRCSEEKDIWLKQQIEKLVLDIGKGKAQNNCLHSNEVQNNKSSVSEMKISELELFSHLRIKQDITKFFSDVSINNGIVPFLNYAIESNIPILTTNYDVALSNLLKLTCYQMPEFVEEPHLYPLSTYFANKPLSDSTSGFGIWHINGIVKYDKSIRLGLSDYLDLIQKIREIMQIDRSSGADILGCLNIPQWKGKYTWLDIVFRKSLFIFGLGLNEDEVSLRWLLLQRAKYNTLFNKGLKGWYIVCKDEKISANKRLFLEYVGINIIEVNDYKTLYDNLWRKTKENGI